jgi:hypothetical protein
MKIFIVAIMTLFVSSAFAQQRQQPSQPSAGTNGNEKTKVILQPQHNAPVEMHIDRPHGAEAHTKSSGGTALNPVSVTHTLVLQANVEAPAPHPSQDGPGNENGASALPKANKITIPANTKAPIPVLHSEPK